MSKPMNHLIKSGIEGAKNSQGRVLHLFARRTCVIGTVLLALNLTSQISDAGDSAPSHSTDFPHDQAQWGRKFSRNMVSSETGLPDNFDPATGRNIKWVADLGTQSFATPIVAGGRVLIGTNNEKPRDPRHKGDRDVLLCLDENDGHLVWQLVVPKISEDEHDPYLDWPKVGFASPPTVEGDRAYVLTNRGEVVCLDMKGMADGNDGPYQNEATHMVPRGFAPLEPGPTDADILWVCDLVKEAGIHTHDQVQGSVLIDGDLLYVNSCNGVDNTHRKIRCPDAPSLVVIDKHIGKLVAVDDEKIGPDIFHCTWSSPSLGEVNGARFIFFCGGNGICYTFEALKGIPPESTSGEPFRLKRFARYDPDPTAPKTDVHRYISNRQVSPSVVMGMPVFDHGRVYLAAGGDLWWGKKQSWLKCFVPRAGEIAAPNEVWSYPMSRESCCTPAVYNDMVFAADCGGTLHCVDAKTGQPLWTYKANGDFWASPLVADGKLYIGTRRGQFIVLAAARELKVISTIDLREPVSGTATAADGRLYVARMTHLYSIGN
jgi:outer membrane protein assembly factor BamB